MISRRFFIHSLAASGLSLAALTVIACSQSHAASPVAVLDKDNDGTVDLAEAKDAAASTFDKLEKDADGTLDFKETGGRLSKKEFKEADPDNDGTLTRDEYLALVEKRFTAADPDADGALGAKELRSTAGRAFFRLVH